MDPRSQQVIVGWFWVENLEDLLGFGVKVACGRWRGRANGFGCGPLHLIIVEGEFSTGTSKESHDDVRATESPARLLTRGITESQHPWAAVGPAAVSPGILLK